ncbi:hypothetical protein SS1G_12663 [Sclerotinia sclerotiorum 1980 UF-70]|uniref:Uncharacterized protein n=1 Tax=Sclerotinia sclerotiorum (strain ATCC 18683 / 1980 / Ss-1) TaxID=665079 RepID=A7F4Y8_SCLS1|nr:hypothetical protein SS1G_12663 [Sclerotinia sclerotiorum 1980 UF-70]EDN97809.1 hypothetical protein SS1G_12663 [Sclerotinia sclerotiorum 1980 UF-70]
MPTSFDNEINHTSSGPSQSNKTKGASAGVQIPTKNAKKNGTARDGGAAGGVMAAVTRSNAAKSLGESPPTLPSSYEDKITNYGYPGKEPKGSPNNHIPSSSPLNTISRRRPLSYQMDGNLPYSPEEYHSALAFAARRTSTYSQQSQAVRYNPYPPLPHQPQAHFHGAPDTNLMLSPRTSGLIPGEKGFYCGFDSYPAQDASKPPNNVIVTGFEGGLSIHNVTKRGVNKILNLDGLRGGVYNSKILPWTAGSEHSVQYPLIAVVVHGPVRTTSENSPEYTTSPESPPAPTDAVGSPRLSTRSIDGENDDDLIECYQTTVEVYSLSTKKHIATLLYTPKIHLPISPSSPLFTAPAPVGSFTIRADRGNVVVASGITGETWIFRHKDKTVSEVEFKCIGKVWTTVQHGLSVDPAVFNNFAEGVRQPEASPRSQYKASILSLNGRWLAYCPSAALSQVSLRATVPETLATGRVPGLISQAPPHIPAVNCLVDTPGGEGVLKQVLQAATQGIVEISGYVGKQGAQYWNNYWNKSAAPQQTNGGNTYSAPQNNSPQFPPTHGLNCQANTTSKDPGLISILDLDSLTQQTSGSSIHPLATFPVPHGCSFLSLAPSGLALFTASSKGDVQFVWDLMRLHYSRSSLLKGAGSQGGGVHGSHVRQIAQFSRMTIARIVDVVWTAPHGERAAMVTEPGTVHILDLPASAFTWPPPRRRIHSGSSDQTNLDSNNATLSAVGVASSAVSSLWTVARPLVGSRRRRSSVGLPGITAASVKSQAGQGTQALAAGISRSVGAATGKMNEMRKSGGTKLHLPKSRNIPSPNCVRFYNGKHGDSIIVVGGGIVRIYTVKSRRADRPADKQKASRGAKYVEFQVPPLPDIRIAPGPVPDDVLGTLARDTADNWKARQVSSRVSLPSGAESSIPQAEIESNAPYQPFHTDRRVNLHIYSHETTTPSSSTSTSGSSDVIVTESTKNAWAFGGPIRSVRLDVGPPQLTEDDYETSSYHRALPSSAIERVMRIADSSHEDMEQIVVTTRRRKGASSNGAINAGNEDEEGFFEDDCEVLDFASQRV